jgi:UDP-GlcNAc:undecaprenyl-phosphate GlcNAc-1-phosphate transferase
MTALMMALAVPILDVFLSIVRRFLRGQPIFAADRGHIHHRLLDKGLTPRRVALLLYGACGLGASLSLVVTVAQNQFGGLILVLFSAGAWLGVQNLGYTEFRMARRLLAAGAFQNMLNAHLALDKLDLALAAATQPEQCWSALEEASASLGFHRVELALAGRRYARQLARTNGHGAWELLVPLAGEDCARLVCSFQSPLPPVAAGQLAEVVRRRLGSASFPRPIPAHRAAGPKGAKAAAAAKGTR